MAQIVTAQFVGQTSCGFVREKYYEIEISAGRSALQFLATFVPTLVIEFLVLLLFGFSLRKNWKIINNEKRPAVNRAEMRQDMNEDILTHGETMSEERLLEGLRKTPELKRRLVMRVAADLLESEAFLEAYPHLETEEQIKTALTRLLHKNKVSTIDGRRMAAELAESYEGMYSHSDRSEGPASGHESHSSQPVT